MRGLLGEGAPLSKSSIRRLRAGWTAEFEEWSQRRLEGREVVYVWADGIYVKARRPSGTRRRCWWCWARCENWRRIQVLKGVDVLLADQVPELL